MIAALVSSYTGKPVEPSTLFFGEVELGGEVRSVPRASERIREGERIGLKRAYVPAKTARELSDVKGLELIPIENIQALSDKL